MIAINNCYSIAPPSKYIMYFKKQKIQANLSFLDLIF